MRDEPTRTGQHRTSTAKVVARFVVVIALILGVGIPVALFHKSPDPVYYLGITMVYVAGTSIVGSLLLLSMRLIRRLVRPAYHASVQLSVRFWKDSMV